MADKKEKKVYKIKWDSEEDGKLYGISIVDSPANKMQTIQLSTQEVKKEINFSVANEKKKQLAGIVLIPNQLIERYNEDLGEYYITFGEEEILKLSEQFLKGDYHKNSWYNHDRDKKVEGNTVVQNWTVEDPKNDKANALGFKDLVKGTWCVVMQLSDEAWETYVESGKVKGFSIDSIMSLEEVKLQDISKKNKKVSMKETIKKVLQMLSNEIESDAEVKEEVEMKEEDSKEEVKAEVNAETESKEEKKEEVNAESESKEEEKEEVNAEDEKEEKSKDEMIADMIKLIEEDEEIMKAIKAKFSNEEEVAKKEEEAVEMKKALELKDKEVIELKSKLDKEPANGRMKADVDMKSTMNLSRQDAIESILNSNK